MLRPSIRYACLETKAFMCMFGSYGTHVFSSHSLKPENGCSKLSDTVQQSNHRLVDNTPHNNSTWCASDDQCMVGCFMFITSQFKGHL